MVLVDSYWKANGEPFCPAADGLSHHINPAGFIEPCPVIQLVKDAIHDEDPEITFEKSEFLRNFRNETGCKTKGCILMEDPAWLENFAVHNNALNSSNRKNYLDDLKNAPVTVSHGSCTVIPETNLFYRLAKKTAFFGGGAYG
jgi:hypothetical protein